jgi:hypothetical protein
MVGFFPLPFTKIKAWYIISMNDELTIGIGSARRHGVLHPSAEPLPNINFKPDGMTTTDGQYEGSHTQ